jgi:GNAT superfamily N-acetyltransferase
MDAPRSRTIVRPACSEDELEQLFRFRYRIYVDEMQRKQKHADHVHRRIRDGLDEFATNLIAWDATGAVVGTVRTNFARDGDLDGYELFYEMASAGSCHPCSTSICTRLMIAPAYRRSLLAVRLAVAVYDVGLKNGITHNFIDCNEHLVPFFEGLGFVRHIEPQEHEDYGRVHCMRLTLHDRERLTLLASAFLPALDRWEQARNVYELTSVGELL